MTRLREYVKKFDLDIAGGLVLLTLGVYARVAWHDFVNYDDPFIVTMNENIRDGLTLHGLRWAFTTPGEGNWIPLSWLSHMLDIQLFGLNPAGHHFVSVLWHTASTVLLFLFLNKTTGERWKSAMVALLFALHPLHVESVAWVAERKDVLSGFFWMLTLCLYASYVRCAGIYRYCACLVSFLLGLLAKPMLVSLPLVLLLIDFWPLGRLEHTGGGTEFGKLPRLLLEKIPFALLTIVVSVITYMTQKADGSVSENYTFVSRAGKALTYYVTYLGKMVWPVGLSVFYPRPFFAPPLITVAGSALLLAAVTLGAIVLGKRYGSVLTGWMWYLVTLLPVIGLVQIGSHSIADRYTYIPLVGIFVMLVWGVSALLYEWQDGALALRMVSCAVVAVMVALTSLQLAYWKNSITLFRHASEVTENNHVAHTNLGNALLQAGRYTESLQYLEMAVAERPADTFALMNLGNAYRSLNEHEKALAAYSRVLLIDPRSDKGHYELGVEHLVVGREQSAIEEYIFLRQAGSGLAPKLLKQIMLRQQAVPPAN
ncbi:MAG TPA: tetratricopeptide repeat protein [Desulfuromonadales bacterium]|nr:tetratricopeptide repeat protein [Desulfuromonadales bacterium]